jgi:hypothetical protein
MEDRIFDAVKDSGERRDFSTGSVRDRAAGKGSPHLASVFALRRYFRHLENGAKKYGDRNWELGQPDSSYVDSAMRHLLAFMEGDKTEDHLAALVWNAAGLIHNDELCRRGFYPEDIHDLADYDTRESFDHTVVQVCLRAKKERESGKA